MDAFEIEQRCFNGEYVNGLRAGLTGCGVHVYVVPAQNHTMLVGFGLVGDTRTIQDIEQVIIAEGKRLQTLDAPDQYIKASTTCLQDEEERRTASDDYGPARALAAE